VTGTKRNVIFPSDLSAEPQYQVSSNSLRRFRRWDVQTDTTSRLCVYLWTSCK